MIDVAKHAVVATLKLDRPSPSQGGRRAPERPVAYVANGGSNDVAVIDVQALKVAAFIPVGHSHRGASHHRDGKKLYVANGVSESISVIDTASQKVVATIPSGKDPVVSRWGGERDPASTPRAHQHRVSRPRPAWWPPSCRTDSFRGPPRQHHGRRRRAPRLWERGQGSTSANLANGSQRHGVLPEAAASESGLLPKGGYRALLRTAEIHRSGACTRKWMRLVQPRRTATPDRNGFAVLIRVQRAEDLGGTPLEHRLNRPADGDVIIGGARGGSSEEHRELAWS